MCARPSDKLYKLTKTISVGMFAKLKAHNDVYARDTAKWRLIESNWKRDSFDPEQDIREFKGNNLPALKYHARKWLVKALAKVAYFPHKDISEMLGEARTAIYRDDMEMAAEIIREGRQLAREREYFREWLHFLEMESRIVCEAYPKEEWEKIATANMQEHRIATACLSNLDEFLKLRNLLELPIAVAYGRDMTYPAHLMEELEKAPVLQDLDRCLSVRSRYEFHTLWAGIKLRKGEIKEAHGFYSGLMQLYEQSDWLRGENLGQYFGHLEGMVGMECLVGNKERSIDLLAHFSNLDMEDPFVLLKSMPWLIYSKFNIAEIFGIAELGNQAVDLWDLHATMLRPRLSLNRQIDFDFSSAKHCITRGAYQKANGYLQRIYDFDLKTRLFYKPHVRALETICALALEKDSVELEHKASMALRFIRRQSVPHDAPLETVLLISKIAKLANDPRAIEEAIKGYLDRLESLSAETHGVHSHSFFNYKAWGTSLLERIRDLPISL